MTKSKRELLKILLLQIREDAVTIEEEIHNFATFAGLNHTQITTINAFQTPKFLPSILQYYDALFIGGSSDASVLHPEKYPFVNACLKLVRYAYDYAIPTFASCFGFQLAVVELGGEVILDKENMEMGIIPITLSHEAKYIPLLEELPETFFAVSGHKERAYRLPNNCLSLAGSKLCPFHLFVAKGKPFYGFQFHPEVDRQTLITRLTRYQHHYLDSTDSLQKIIDAATIETPESNALLKHFIDKIVLA